MSAISIIREMYFTHNIRYIRYIRYSYTNKHDFPIYTAEYNSIADTADIMDLMLYTNSLEHA